MEKVIVEKKRQDKPEAELSRGEILERLVGRAREDPAFFHALVFEPERALDELGYLDRRQKGSIISIRPEQVIAGIVGAGGLRGGGEVGICGHTCEDSCDSTCGSGSCFGTCLSGTCDFTCGARSCDITVELTGRFEAVSLPWESSRVAFRQWSRR